MRDNTLKKAQLIKALVDQHFEPGRQDRSAIHIYRTVVRKIYPISERSFWRLMRIARDHELSGNKSE